MFLLVAIVVLLVLPSPWNVVGAVVAIVAFLGEVGFWQRRVRGKRHVVGGDTLVGREVVVLTPCRPSGQVRADGEIWSAVCQDGADAGERVRVVARKGLQLVVSRLPSP